VFKTVLLLLTPVLLGAAPASAPSMPRIHAHNDYLHPRPLLDALGAGARSVEADIYLVNGALLVAHKPSQVDAKRSLQSLYLDPLRKRIAEHKGSVYGDGETLVLLIDIKADPTDVYPALRTVLQQYADLLTHYTPRKKDGPITVILTGMQPARKIFAEETDRLVASDGSLQDLVSNPSPDLVPWISREWQKSFQWNGSGAMPEDERAKLSEIVQQAHEQHRTVRFWGGPDNDNTWRVLQSAGVDWINTDHLSEASEFLKDN
jgi:hypothetical protein